MAPAIDRLSLLPESLITIILSLIPLKDAVQTSVLSKNWIHSWKSIFNIEIIATDFFSHSNCLNFTHRWFRNYSDEDIERFSLTISRNIGNQSRSIIETFIDFAIKHKTKALELDFPSQTSFELPKIVYEYESLTVLKLFSCKFESDSFVNVSSIKTLSFGRMDLHDFYTLNDFLENCGNLESLSLFECMEALSYTVMSDSLERLVVERCNDLSHIVIGSPNLKSFKFVGRLIKFQLLYPRVLDEVDLNFANESCTDEKACEMVLEALMDFRRSRVLTLCSFTVQSMFMTPPMDSWCLPKKLRTKHLTLSSRFHHTEYYAIVCLMTSCPILEKIQFDMIHRQIRRFEIQNLEEDYYDEQESEGEEEVKEHPCEGMLLETFWKANIPIPKCIKKTLQEVEINGFIGSINEMWFLKFLFEHGLQLRTIRLRFAKFRDGTPMEEFENVRTDMSSWVCNSPYKLNILFE